MLDDLDDGNMSIASEDSITAAIADNKPPKGEGEEDDDEDAGVEEGKTDYTLNLLALGDFSHPAIRLDKTLVEVANAPELGPTVLPQDQGIILKTQAPSLLNKSSTLKVHQHTLIFHSFTNTYDHPLSFSVIL